MPLFPKTPATVGMPNKIGWPSREFSYLGEGGTDGCKGVAKQSLLEQVIKVRCYVETKRPVSDRRVESSRVHNFANYGADSRLKIGRSHLPPQIVKRAHKVFLLQVLLWTDAGVIVL